MDSLEIFIVSIASLLLLSGAFSLAATWHFPQILDRPRLRLLLTGTGLPPTRSNRTIMAIWSMLFAAYLLSSTLGYPKTSFVLFFIWLPFAYLVFSRSFQSQAKV
jgi:hypothetical protein